MGERSGAPAGKGLLRRRNLTKTAMALVVSLIATILLPAIPAHAATGEILIYAGGGGQVGSARGTSLLTPRGVVADTNGNLYFSEAGFHRIRKVDAQGAIKTIAGSGEVEGFESTGAATSLSLATPTALALDSPNNRLYVADTEHHAVRVLDVSEGGTSREMTTVLGTDGEEAKGDPTVQIQNKVTRSALTLGFPEGLAVKRVTGSVTETTLFVSDHIPNSTGQKAMVWKLDLSQENPVLKEACPKKCDFLGAPAGLSVDSDGNLLIADRGKHVIFKVTFDADGVPKTTATVAGIENDNNTCHSSDDRVATNSTLNAPYDVVAASSTITYIADTANHAIRKVEGGLITTTAGTTGTDTLGCVLRGSGFSPYDVLGTEAALASPKGVAIDPVTKNVLFSDSGNNRVRQVDSSGAIATAIGLSCCFFKGDGGLALDALLNEPEGVSVSKGGDICLADRLDHRVRCIDEQGVITSEIGTGIPGGLPFEVPAGLALLNGPTKPLFDDARGIMYIANNGGSYIAKVEDGLYSIVARFRGGDETPQDLTVDSSGALYAIVHTQSNGMKNIFRMDPANGYVPVSIVKGACVPGSPEQLIWEALGLKGTSGGTVRCPGGLVSDKDDNLYISDGARHVVWRAEPRSTCQSPTVLGYCLKVFAGRLDTVGNDDDSSSPKATSVRLNNPASLTIDDDSRNIYLNDAGNGRIRKLDLVTGAISTVAGGGNAEIIYGESSLLARIHAYLEWRNTSQGGELILSGLKGKFRAARIDLSTPTPTVTPLAGGGNIEQAVGRMSVESILQRPGDVTEGPTGTVYIAEALSNRILAIDPGSGEIYAVKGASDLSFPRGIAVDELGQFLFVSEEGRGNITKVNLVTGATTTVASGLIAPSGIALRDGAVYFAETSAHVVRKLLPTGDIVTVAGRYAESDGSWDCNNCGFADSGLAVDSSLFQPRDVALDEAGNIYIADTGHAAVQKVDKNTGEIRTIHTHPTKARAKPYGVAIGTGEDPLFVAYGTPTDEVWHTSSDEWLSGTRVAGNCSNYSSYCPLGDGGQAQDAALRNPANVSVGLVSGALYIADEENNRIRKIEAPVGSFATIATIAGAGATGDGGKAVEANLGAPEGIAVFGANTYVADTLHHRIRRIEAVGSSTTVTTVAGTGIAGYSGEGTATRAQLNNPEGLAVDSYGNLYVADSFNHRIRKITPSGTITTVAGDGKYIITLDGDVDPGSPQDGEVATNTSLRFPRG